MKDSASTRVMCSIYAVMMYAYPREFRLRYGIEMEQFFRDKCREQGQSWFPLALRTLSDWVVSTIRERRSAPRKLIQEWAVTLLMFLFVTTTMVQAYVVPTGSMESNIMIGDHMLVDKVGFENGGNNWGSYVLPHRDVKRGDIIAFRYPEDVRQTWVKRVIGVPGDHIRLVEKQVFRNGELLNEPYVSHSSPSIDDDRDNFPTAAARERFARDVHGGEVIVPSGMLFVMGDNRDNSLDSRYIGFVPDSYVVGKPLVIYWSYDAPTSELESWSLAHMKDVALHFFSKTRWDRTLTTPQ